MDGVIPFPSAKRLPVITGFAPTVTMGPPPVFGALALSVVDAPPPEQAISDHAVGAKPTKATARKKPSNRTPGASGRPVITIAAGDVANIATDCESALIDGDAAIFQRGNKLVRPLSWEAPASDERVTQATGFEVMTTPALIDDLAKHAEFWKWDARTSRDVPADPPSLAVSVLLSRAGLWRFKPVGGILSAPTLRRDGSVLSAPGYDPQTRFFMMPDRALVMPEMPDNPDCGDALDALETLNGLLREFPFVADVDRAVALSGIISPVVRGALGAVPLHAFTAPTPGTGKSFLADIASAIQAGGVCPVATAGKTEEETEKRLGSLLMAGVQLVSIDNVSAPLGGDLLCQMVERPVVLVRVLGKLETVNIECRATVFANGNNLVLAGDMTRRTVLARLDTGMERPELRSFARNPVDDVLADRGKYVAACLTIVRAYILAGRPGKLPPLQSYGHWSDNVRSALVWLGCADAAASVSTIRAADPELTELADVLEAWWGAYRNRDRKCGDVIAQMRLATTEADIALRDALLLACPGRNGELDALRLGHWLKSRKGRPVTLETGASLRFISGGKTNQARWSVQLLAPVEKTEQP